MLESLIGRLQQLGEELLIHDSLLQGDLSFLIPSTTARSLPQPARARIEVSRRRVLQELQLQPPKRVFEPEAHYPLREDRRLHKDQASPPSPGSQHMLRYSIPHCSTTIKTEGREPGSPTYRNAPDDKVEAAGLRYILTSRLFILRYISNETQPTKEADGRHLRHAPVAGVDEGASDARTSGDAQHRVVRGGPLRLRGHGDASPQRTAACQ